MPAQTAQPPAWLRSAAVWVGAALAVLALVVLGVAVLPGWWADLVGSWVLGVTGRGIPIGILIGALFTALPLAVGVLATRTGMSPRTRVVTIVIALLLLLPNVLTLAVALGAGEAHSALVIAAPGFRGGSVAGVALVIVALVVVLVVRRRGASTRAQIAAAHGEAVEVGRARAEQNALRGRSEQAGPDAESEPSTPSGESEQSRAGGPGSGSGSDAPGEEPERSETGGPGGELDQPHG